MRWRQVKERINRGKGEEVGGSRAADRTIGLLWMLRLGIDGRGNVQGAGAVTEEGGTTRLEPPYDSS